MMMAAYKAHKVSGASAQDGMFALAKEPAADSPSGLLSLEPLCLACDYMPLVYYIYNPPGAPSPFPLLYLPPSHVHAFGNQQGGWGGFRLQLFGAGASPCCATSSGHMSRYGTYGAVRY